MIKSLQIVNFLSHKYADIEFSPGVNIIVGPTDSGKSAIIRALRWAITNRPTGDSFRSNWGGDTEVEMILDDTSIRREKGTINTNLYSLGDVKTSDYLEFKAFGSGVPEEIEKALNLNTVNIQTQFESHFLLSRSAGEVASHFNKVAHLDKIDVGLQNIQRWLKKVQQTILMNEDQIESLTEQLLEYDNIEDIEERVICLEEIEKDERITRNKQTVLAVIVDKVTVINLGIRELEIIASKEKPVNTVLSILTEQETIKEAVSRLDRAHRRILETNNIINELKGIIVIEESINRALEIEDDILEIGMEEFENLVDLIRGTNVNIKMEEASIKEKEKLFHENIGEVCPLCGVLQGVKMTK